MDTFDPETERWEQAVANRLSKLRTMPVETGRLAVAVQGHVPRPAAVRGGWWRSGLMIRAAASLLLVTGLAAVVAFVVVTRPAMASPSQMARMHEELVTGAAPAVQVDSVEAANRVLAGESPQFPELPGMPAEHVMACCMRSVKDKKVACLLMKREGVPLSMMVARSRDMRVPASPVTVRDGVEYHVQSSGSLNMVMTERHGRWVCLIGELPADGLMDVAVQLKF